MAKQVVAVFFVFVFFLNTPGKSSKQGINYMVVKRGLCGLEIVMGAGAK